MTRLNNRSLLKQFTEERTNHTFTGEYINFRAPCTYCNNMGEGSHLSLLVDEEAILRLEISVHNVALVHCRTRAGISIHVYVCMYVCIGMYTRSMKLFGHAAFHVRSNLLLSTARIRDIYLNLCINTHDSIHTLVRV
jgi:hypothetical protein